MSRCDCEWELYEDESVLCNQCKEVLDHPHELSKELIKTQARVKELEEKLSSTETMLEIVQGYADQYIENGHLQEMYDELKATPKAN